MPNSIAKGKRGEREWAKWLADEFGCNSRRGQQFSGSPDSPDVVGGFTGTHCEVKRVERLNIYDAVEQACGDSSESMVPYVAHRRNNKEWLVTIRASDIKRFANQVAATEKIKDLPHANFDPATRLL